MTQRQIHNLEVSEVWSLLRSRADGLRPDEVAHRLAEIGPNTLSPPPRGAWLRLLLKQFANLFSLLLDVSAVLCFVADQMQPGGGMALLGWALVCVAVLNALFTFAQAMRAERAMQALRKMLPQHIVVRRGGVEARVAIQELVPGDLLLLSEGDRVPADARLVESSDLLANKELVKDLAARFKARIEMRQIGVRDKAKLVGGFGLCGQELCCKAFLTNFEPISIKMAKQQDLTLNTGKLSGACGRLMCCLEI